MQRAVMITILGTVTCSRVSELANLQMCDVLWNFDAAYHSDLVGGLAICIYKRKQATGRFEHYPLIPPGSFATMFRAYLERLAESLCESA